MAVELHSAGAPTDGDRLIGTLGDWQPGIGTFPDGVVDGRAEGGLRSDKSCYPLGREYRWLAKLPTGSVRYARPSCPRGPSVWRQGRLASVRVDGPGR
jgi:hypothetical protein